MCMCVRVAAVQHASHSLWPDRAVLDLVRWMMAVLKCSCLFLQVLDRCSLITFAAYLPHNNEAWLFLEAPNGLPDKEKAGTIPQSVFFICSFGQSLVLELPFHTWHRCLTRYNTTYTHHIHIPSFSQVSLLCLQLRTILSIWVTIPYMA